MAWDKGQGVALVSAPWPLFNRPSLQLGALKAFLRARLPGLRVDAHHHYLSLAQAVGYPVYQALSERTWLAECVYALLLHPGRRERIERLFRRQARGRPALKGLDLERLADQARQAGEAFLAATDWSAYRLVGFSLCLCQLTATLWLLRRLRELHPGLTLVAGGSMFAGAAAAGLLRLAPELDYVVSGEGELPLLALVEALRAGRTPRGVAGLVGREEVDEPAGPGCAQVEDLDSLPLPEFGDYFQALAGLPPERRFIPALPLELSRGCSWQAAERGGCAFCNLNLQWQGYRSKSPRRAAAEVEALTRRHQSLGVAFMDNLLPAAGAEETFDSIAALGRDLSLFGEIRATTPRRVLAAMRRAGMQEVQIGIEALSTRLLKKLNKGTTAIANLEAMRHCEELGIKNGANLILHFPGSDQQDVAQTLEALEFAACYRPLSPASFWLGLESPVWRRPGEFGLSAVFNHPNYRALFPSSALQGASLVIQGYRGGRGEQKKLWRPVAERLRRWRREYQRLRARPLAGPILSYADGGDFMLIRERRVVGEPRTHRLTGPSRGIYLFCTTRRRLGAILERFPLGEDKVLGFLRMMRAKRLMFSEGDRWLSLARVAPHQP